MNRTYSLADCVADQADRGLRQHRRAPVIAPEFVVGDHNCSDHHHTRRDLGHDLLLWSCVTCGARTFTYRIDAPVSAADEVTAIADAPNQAVDPHRWWRVAGFVLAALCCAAVGAGLATAFIH